MNYSRQEAKTYARENMRGIWAGALQPFQANLALDEAGTMANIRHWVEELGIDGVFIAGKQGEFFSMSVAERKRALEIAEEATRGTNAGTIMS
jgi:4-hydroxy-tetrahydrodipicolinate synthase